MGPPSTDCQAECRSQDKPAGCGLGDDTGDAETNVDALEGRKVDRMTAAPAQDRRRQEAGGCTPTAAANARLGHATCRIEMVVAAMSLNLSGQYVDRVVWLCGIAQSGVS